MKVGILGLGSIGARHAKNLIGLGHEVIGYDPADFRREEKLGLGLAGVVLEDRDRVLCTSDAFVIASPTKQHWTDIRDTAVAGKPTFLEKPVGAVTPHCAENASHILMVGYNLRFHGVVKKAKELLPKIGKLIWAHFVCAQYNDKPVYLRDGVILNWSHEIDLALYLLGHGRCTSASSNECESLADINILHCNGCRSSVHIDYLTKPEQRYFKIVGEEGYLQGTLYPGRYLHFLRFVNPGPENESKMIDADDSYDENYVEEMQAFIDRIHGKPTIGATYRDGTDVLEICCDAKYGHWQG